MTFIVNHQGVVFQKDLGQQTNELASTMTQYDPDDSWDPVQPVDVPDTSDDDDTDTPAQNIPSVPGGDLSGAPA